MSGQTRAPALSRRSVPGVCAKKRPIRGGHKKSVNRIRLESLEDRSTPSVLSTFELDGNVETGTLSTLGSTTPSHDWDEVFAGTSGAMARFAAVG